MRNFYSLISVDSERSKDDFYNQIQMPENRLSIGWGFEDHSQLQTYDQIREMIERNYFTRPRTDHNLNNGAKSLMNFKNLNIGDIIFVRGDSKIIDVVEIVGLPYYQFQENPAQPDYLTFVEFHQLRPNNNLILLVRDIPEPYRYEFIFEFGRSLVMNKLDSDLALELLLLIIRRN